MASLPIPFLSDLQLPIPGRARPAKPADVDDPAADLVSADHDHTDSRVIVGGRHGSPWDDDWRGGRSISGGGSGGYGGGYGYDPGYDEGHDGGYGEGYGGGYGGAHGAGRSDSPYDEDDSGYSAGYGSMGHGGQGYGSQGGYRGGGRAGWREPGCCRPRGRRRAARPGGRRRHTWRRVPVGSA